MKTSGGTPQENHSFSFWRNVALKGLLLFGLVVACTGLWNPEPVLGHLSAYNLLFPGRQRFPFGEDIRQAYNLSLNNVDAMFASHELAGSPKDPDEFRVLVLGDSAVWGTLLRPAETLSGQLNAMHLTRQGQRVRVFNVGYPTLSLSKDVMLLEQAKIYQPDLVVWLVTLESFPREKQLASPLLANNPQRVEALVRNYGLQLDLQSSALVRPGYAQRTLIGQRRALADLLRLQLVGVLWAATGVDQVYPANYPAAQVDLAADERFFAWKPGEMKENDLAFDSLEAGFVSAGQTPVLLVNEPMLVSSGVNSALRYNFFYPRWAYDTYRSWLLARCQANGWRCLDVWDLVPAAEFTNSAIHLTPAGEALLAQKVAAEIVR